MKKRIFKAMWLSVMAVVVVTVSSCSSDSDFFGLDGLEDFKSTQISTKSGLVDISEYLTISTCNSEKWTENDYRSIDKAIQRMNISYSKNRNQYIINEQVKASELNMSDSLYCAVTTMLEYTNYIFANSSNNNKRRIKSRSTEQGGLYILPDCVPAAVSNMGQNAPSYESAIAKCDELYPNWRNEGGIPSASVESFIELYTSVTPYNDLSFCGTGEQFHPNYVITFGSHAANAYRSFKDMYGGCGIIYYTDSSASSILNGGSGILLASESFTIYVF